MHPFNLSHPDVETPHWFPVLDASGHGFELLSSFVESIETKGKGS